MTKKLLRVTGSTATAVAILQQTGSAWTVARTAPSLAWMRGLDMPAIKQRLTDDGATWEWLPVSAQFAQLAEPPPQAPKRGKVTSTTTKPDSVESDRPTANVSVGEQLWFNGVQNAIAAEARKAAIVRNGRGYGKRKDKVTE